MGEDNNDTNSIQSSSHSEDSEDEKCTARPPTPGVTTEHAPMRGRGRGGRGARGRGGGRGRGKTNRFSPILRENVSGRSPILRENVSGRSQESATKIKIVQKILTLCNSILEEF